MTNNKFKKRLCHRPVSRKKLIKKFNIIWFQVSAFNRDMFSVKIGFKPNNPKANNSIMYAKAVFGIYMTDE